MGARSTPGDDEPRRQHYRAGHQSSRSTYRVQSQCTITKRCDEYSYSTALGASGASLTRKRGAATAPKHGHDRR
eukprot:977706-Pyramimonas_sp.AAC.1